MVPPANALTSPRPHGEAATAWARIVPVAPPDTGGHCCWLPLFGYRLHHATAEPAGCRRGVGRGAEPRIAKAGPIAAPRRTSIPPAGRPQPTRPTKTRWLRAMRALSSLGHNCCSRPSVRQSFFPFAHKARPLVRANDIRLLLRAAERANHAASHGLIWPKDGCASIASAATAVDRLSSPGLRPFLAKTRKSRRRHPPLRYGPKTGASSIAFGLQIAIEAAMVAGSNTKEK